MRRLYEIDLLRILAAVIVVFFHYAFTGWMQGHTSLAFPTFGAVARYGYLGVDLFFMISGFVVLLSAWGRRPHQFLISRIVRLYPAFWFAVTLTALVSVLSGAFPVSLGQYLANLTMVHPVLNVADIDVVYWTLWAEIRFYVIVFVLAWIGLTRRRVLNTLWGWLALTGLFQLGLLPSIADVVLQTTFAHYFIAGMALGLIHRFGMTWEVAAILVVSYANALYRGIGFASDVADRYQVAFHPWVIVVVIWLIYLVMLLVALGVTTPLGRPWYSVAGSLTYPLYLVHAHIGFVLLAWFGELFTPGPALRWALMLGLVGAMMVFAYGVHVLVERPLAPRLKRLLESAARVLPGARPGPGGGPGPGGEPGTGGGPGAVGRQPMGPDPVRVGGR